MLCSGNPDRDELLGGYGEIPCTPLNWYTSKFILPFVIFFQPIAISLFPSTRYVLHGVPGSHHSLALNTPPSRPKDLDPATCCDLYRRAHAHVQRVPLGLVRRSSVGPFCFRSLCGWCSLPKTRLIYRLLALLGAMLPVVYVNCTTLYETTGVWKGQTLMYVHVAMRFLVSGLASSHHASSYPRWLPRHTACSSLHCLVFLVFFPVPLFGCATVLDAKTLAGPHMHPSSLITHAIHSRTWLRQPRTRSMSRE